MSVRERHSLRPGPGGAVGLLALAMAVCLSCRPPAGGELLKLAPRLGPEMAAHLLEDSPAEFRQAARRLGPSALLSARISLMLAPLASLPDFSEVEARLAPHVRTLVTTLEEEFGISRDARAYAAYLERPVQDRIRAVSIVQRHLDLLADTSLGLEERVARIETLIEDGRPYADIVNLGDQYGPYCELLPRLGRMDDMVRSMREAADYALAYGDTSLACQYLGMLGVQFDQAGDDAAMRGAWDRGLDLARRSRSWHEARILSFYAGHYFTAGDPARSLEMLCQAEARCRELGADETEIRFLLRKLRQFADMGCWDLVERGLARADVLIRDGQGRWQEAERALYTVQVRGYRMQLLTVKGATRQAVRAARDVLARAGTWPASPNREVTIASAARVLGQCGLTGESRQILAGVIARSESLGITEYLPRFQLEMTDLNLQLGDTTGCRRLLESTSRAMTAEARIPPRFAIRQDLLETRLAWRTQGRTAAARRLAEGLRRLERERPEFEASPEALMARTGMHGYRTLFHELHADRPALGYLFEMAWARLVLPGRGAEGPGPSLVAEAAADDRPLALPPLPPDVVHCVYAPAGGRLVRWTRTGDSVTREEMGIETGDLDRLLERAVGRLSTPPAGDPGTGAELIADLHELARILLPETLFDPADHRRLLVTRDGLLHRLPFEALSLSGDTYRPLLLQRDIAYLNPLGAPGGTGPLRRPRDGSDATAEITLVVIDPRYDAELTRQWSVLSEPLPHSVGEGLRFAETADRPVVLRGSAATRGELLSRWETAGQLHLATHFVSEPESPYNGRIPLAGEPGRAGSLGREEILGADLAGSRLVVLSGCATGVRYHASGLDLPSFGDLFLGAGARAVVVTGWSVRDEDGAAVMHEFNEFLATGRGDPAAALGDARRAMIRRSIHPHVWAAYSILIQEPAMAGDAEEGTASAWNRER